MALGLALTEAQGQRILSIDGQDWPLALLSTPMTFGISHNGSRGIISFRVAVHYAVTSS